MGNFSEKVADAIFLGNNAEIVDYIRRTLSKN